MRGIGFVVAGNPAWFGITTSGSVVHGLMHVSDWLPTLCDPLLADCDMSQGGGKKLDGVSASDNSVTPYIPGIDLPKDTGRLLRLPLEP